MCVFFLLLLMPHLPKEHTYIERKQRGNHEKIHPKISFYSLSHVVIDVYRVYARTISFFFGTHPQFIFALYFKPFDCYPIPSSPPPLMPSIHCVLYWLVSPASYLFLALRLHGADRIHQNRLLKITRISRLFSFQSKDYEMPYWFNHSSPFTLVFITAHTIVEKYEIFLFIIINYYICSAFVYMCLICWTERLY